MGLKDKGYLDIPANRFFQDHVDSAMSEPAWFYQAREGHHGPFPTREAAARDLADLIAANPSKRRRRFFGSE